MELVLAFLLFALFFAGMSIGLVFRNKPLKGSCGGVANLMGNTECEFCGGDPNKCDEVNDRPTTRTELAYDASGQKSDH